MFCNRTAYRCAGNQVGSVLNSNEELVRVLSDQSFGKGKEPSLSQASCWQALDSNSLLCWIFFYKNVSTSSTDVLTLQVWRIFRASSRKLDKLAKTLTNTTYLLVLTVILWMSRAIRTTWLLPCRFLSGPLPFIYCCDYYSRFRGVTNLRLDVGEFNCQTLNIFYLLTLHVLHRRRREKQEARSVHLQSCCWGKLNSAQSTLHTNPFLDELAILSMSKSYVLHQFLIVGMPSSPPPQCEILYLAETRG